MKANSRTQRFLRELRLPRGRRSASGTTGGGPDAQNARQRRDARAPSRRIGGRSSPAAARELRKHRPDAVRTHRTRRRFPPNLLDISRRRRPTARAGGRWRAGSATRRMPLRRHPSGPDRGRPTARPRYRNRLEERPSEGDAHCSSCLEGAARRPLQSVWRLADRVGHPARRRRGRSARAGLDGDRPESSGFRTRAIDVPAELPTDPPWPLAPRRPCLPVAPDRA
jgi:hypothetical protein